MSSNPRDKINPATDGDTLEKFLATMATLDSIAAIQEILKDKTNEQKVENLKRSIKEEEIENENTIEEVSENETRLTSIIKTILDALYSALGIQLKDISTEEILYILICKTKTKNLQMFANIKNREYLTKILVASILTAMNNGKDTALASSISGVLNIGYEKQSNYQKEESKEKKERSLNANRKDGDIPNNNSDNATHSTSVANHLSPSFNSQSSAPETRQSVSQGQDNIIIRQSLAQNIERGSYNQSQIKTVKEDYEHDARHQSLSHKISSIVDPNRDQRNATLVTALFIGVVNKVANFIKEEINSRFSSPQTQHIRHIHHQSNNHQSHGNRSFLRDPVPRANYSQNIPYSIPQQRETPINFNSLSHNKLPEQPLGILLIKAVVAHQSLTVITPNISGGIDITHAEQTTFTQETTIISNVSKAIPCDTSKVPEIGAGRT